MFQLKLHSGKFRCPHCEKTIKTSQKFSHLKSLTKVGGKWVCVGRPEHPRHKENEAHKKAIGQNAWK